MAGLVLAHDGRTSDRPLQHPDALAFVPDHAVAPMLAALACFGLILGLERSNWMRP